MTATRHEVTVADGLATVAVHHAADGGGPTVVFCHGFRSDKTGSYEGRCERLVAAGYDAVRFDFRGCGEADGAFAEGTLSARVEDLRAVVAALVLDRVVLVGSSLGAAVALYGLDRLRADGVTVEGVAGRAPVTYTRAFDDLRERVREEGAVTFETGETVGEAFLADLAGYDFADVTGVDAPVLFVHGGADGSVPVGDTVAAVEALETDVLFEKLVGEGHRFSAAGERRFRDRLVGWLAGV